MYTYSYILIAKKSFVCLVSCNSIIGCAFCARLTNCFINFKLFDKHSLANRRYCVLFQVFTHKTYGMGLCANDCDEIIMLIKWIQSFQNNTYLIRIIFIMQVRLKYYKEGYCALLSDKALIQSRRAHMNIVKFEYYLITL